jgi:lysyl-tRNA synthetase class 2
VSGQPYENVVDIGARYECGRGGRPPVRWRCACRRGRNWRPRYVVVDAVEFAAAGAVAIADAESIWELPVIGRFLGRRA